MTIKQALTLAKKTFKENKVAEAEASADFLMRTVLKSCQPSERRDQGITRAKLFSMLDKELTKKEERIFSRYISRRKKHEPVWQIVGAVDFWGMNLKVNKNVLVPRPETEFLVQEALKEISILNSKIKNKSKIKNPNTSNLKREPIRASKTNNELRILDVGTGAGPIAIALARELKTKNTKHKIFASDISTKVLSVAKKNAKTNGVGDKIKFIHADLFDLVSDSRSLNPIGKFDIITANLPYIPHEEMPTLAPDVTHHEPRKALDGGAGGLEIYEEFLRQLPDYLGKKGMAFCEIGAGQGKEFTRMVKKYLPGKGCLVKKDLAGFDRIAIITNRVTK